MAQAAEPAGQSDPTPAPSPRKTEPDPDAEAQRKLALREADKARRKAKREAATAARINAGNGPAPAAPEPAAPEPVAQPAMPSQGFKFSADEPEMQQLDVDDCGAGTESHGFKFSADEDFDSYGGGTAGGSGFGGGPGFGQPKKNAQVAGASLTFEESRDCRALVLGKGSFDEAWRQGLYWTHEEGLSFGLWQQKGGPCGVIAAVQVRASNRPYTVSTTG